MPRHCDSTDPGLLEAAGSTASQWLRLLARGLEPSLRVFGRSEMCLGQALHGSTSLNPSVLSTRYHTLKKPPPPRTGLFRLALHADLHETPMEIQAAADAIRLP